jgi:hypothetical protein
MTKLIDRAIKAVEQAGSPMTPTNVKSKVNLSHLTVAEAVDALKRELEWRVGHRLKAKGYIIGDTVTRERVRFANAALSELEEQGVVLAEHEDAVTRRNIAWTQMIAFLQAKQSSLGTPVTPAMFQADVERIYLGQGVESPF